MNARIQNKEDPQEECIGPHTFNKSNNRLAGQTEEASNNRSRLIEYCNDYNLKLMNTYFCKQE
eukprot:6032187-Karenia_brevis.AAC.1